MEEPFVCYLLRSIEEVLGDGVFTATHRKELCQRIEIDYGGDRPYIQKNGEAAKKTISSRNADILRDWQSGERAPAIARKHGITRARVWQIVNER